jgi:hypothetical protein
MVSRFPGGGGAKLVALARIVHVLLDLREKVTQMLGNVSSSQSLPSVTSAHVSPAA